MNPFSKELNNNMTPVYVGKFNLSHHPFSSQYNATLYFESEGRKIIAKKIAHLLDFTKLILFIQGANGLGKTTLIRQRLRNAKKNWKICFISAKDITTPQALMTRITADMNIKFIQDPHAQSLHEQLGAMQQAGLNPILFIDDIEHLNKALIPTLASLIQHTSDTEPKIRLVISGQDISAALTSIIPEHDGNSMLKYVPLPPLSEIECAEYIKHRLQVSGYEYLEPFNKNQLKKIYLDAKGFPIVINQLADHLFTQYALDYENKKPVLNFNEKTNKLLKVAAGGLGTLVLTFILYTTFDSIDITSEDQRSDLEIQTLQIPTILDKNTEEMVSATTQPKLPAIIKEPKKTVLKTKPEIEPEKIPDITPKKEIQKELTIKPITTKTPPPKKVNAKITKPKNTNLKPSIKNTAWIKAKNPKHYTLQLISGSNRNAALKFIKKHNLGKHAAIFHSKRKGKDWYSVIYKSFKNSKSANRAIRSLPKSLKRIKPWPRPFSAIQKSME